MDNKKQVVYDGSIPHGPGFVGMGSSRFACMSAYDRFQLQQNYGASYEQQEEEKLATLLALGGYEAQDGSVYSINSDGQLSFTATVTVSNAAMMGPLNWIHGYGTEGWAGGVPIVEDRAFEVTKVVAHTGDCPNCLDPSSIGHNLLGLSYPGANNPKSKNLQDNFSYVPSNLAEYPAIGHDRRYSNLKINGASGLLTNTRAIGADWRFVGEELSIAANPYLNPIDRMSAGILGVGLGLSALPKTLFQLSVPFGYMQTMMWYNISNQGVNNAPTIHNH